MERTLNLCPLHEKAQWRENKPMKVSGRCVSNHRDCLEMPRIFTM